MGGLIPCLRLRSKRHRDSSPSERAGTASIQNPVRESNITPHGQPLSSTAANHMSSASPKPLSCMRPNGEAILNNERVKSKRKRLSSIINSPSLPKGRHVEVKRVKQPPPSKASPIFSQLREAASLSFYLLEPLTRLQEWHHQNRTPSKQYTAAALLVLKGHFPSLGKRAAASILKDRVYLLPSFLRLFNDQTDGALSSNSVQNPTSNQDRLRKRVIRRAGLPYHERIIFNTEFAAIEKLHTHTVNGEASNEVQCSCCGDDCEVHDAFPCTGQQVHFFCQPCMKQYVEVSLIGSGRAQPECFATVSELCTGTIEMAYIKAAVDPRSATRLESMQQQNDLREAFDATGAGANDCAVPGRLEQCPGCEYQAWTDDHSKATLFECQNPDCRQITCRACREKAHWGVSCKATKAKPTIAHAVEDALSDRLIRTCSKCKYQTTKDPGFLVRACNKMTCPVCHTVSCYICGQTGIDYNHFDQPQGKRCSLWSLPPIDAASVSQAAYRKLAGSKELEHDSQSRSLKARIDEELAKHLM